MPAWLSILVPVMNFVVIVAGGLYGLSVLKIALQAFTEKLERVAAAVEDHEHRLTVIETTCRNRNCDTS